MSDFLLKDKNQEPSKDDYEPLKQMIIKTNFTKKNRKFKFAKYLLTFNAIILITATFTYYIYYKKSSISLNESDNIMQKYNELGKKNENLKLFPHLELFLENLDTKFVMANLILHFNKEDVDKNRLVEAINKMVRNQAVLQSNFYKEMADII